MRDQLLPRALDCLEHVLRVHDGPKAGEWLTHPVLYHLTHASSHVMHGRLYLVNQIDPSVVVAEHTFREHITHGFTRLGMAVELFERETGARS